MPEPPIDGRAGQGITCLQALLDEFGRLGLLVHHRVAGDQAVPELQLLKHTDSSRVIQTKRATPSLSASGSTTRSHTEEGTSPLAPYGTVGTSWLRRRGRLRSSSQHTPCGQTEAPGEALRIPCRAVIGRLEPSSFPPPAASTGGGGGGGVRSHRMNPEGLML